MIGIGLAQFGDVVRDRAAGLRRKNPHGRRRETAAAAASAAAQSLAAADAFMSCRLCCASCRAKPVARRRRYVASARAETGPMMLLSGRCAAAAGACQVSMIASTCPSATTSSMLHENRFERAGGGRGHRDLHLHGFDERDVVAIADAPSDFDGQRADATGHLGHDLDLWHATLRGQPPRAQRSRCAHHEGRTPSAFCCGAQIA